QQVVFIEAELADTLGKPVLHFVIRAAKFPHPNSASFVQDVGRAVCAFEGAAAAGSQDRVLRQAVAGFRFTCSVLNVKVQSQRETVGLWDCRGHDGVPSLLARAHWIEFATLDVQWIA